MISPKENLLRMYNGELPEYLPLGRLQGVQVLRLYRRKEARLQAG